MNQIDAKLLATDDDIASFKDQMIAITDRVMSCDTINPHDYEALWREAALVIGAPLTISDNILPPGWIVATTSAIPEIVENTNQLGGVDRVKTGKTFYDMSVTDTKNVDPNDSHVFRISHPVTNMGAHVICAILAWTKVRVAEARERMRTSGS